MRPGSSKYRRKTGVRRRFLAAGHRFHRGQTRRLLGPKARTTLMILCFLGLVISGVRLIQYSAESRQVLATNETVQALYHEGDGALEVKPTAIPAATGVLLKAPEPSPEPVKFLKSSGSVLPKFKSLLKMNRDVVGWLNIHDMIDLPVVYRDNTYYLRRDIKKKKSSAGTLFLDENHPLRASAQNLIIHGHNMLNGSMFGRLHRYLRLSYLQKHSVMRFNTLYEENTYVVIAVLVVPDNADDPGYVNYLGHPSFRSGKQFLDYANELVERSVYEIPIDINETDALLTLSTCYEDERLLVVGRRLRPEESLSDVKARIWEAHEK